MITTAQRSITGAIVVTVFDYTQPLANVSVTIINTVGILVLLLLAVEWRRAGSRRAPAAEGTSAPPGPVETEASPEKLRTVTGQA